MTGRWKDADRAFKRFIRQHQRRERPEPDVRGLPEEWKDRRRRPVNAPPPDFSRDDAQVMAYAERRLHDPCISDVKRVEGGGAAYLVRDRRGRALMVVLSRAGRIRRVGSEQDFHDMPECLGGTTATRRARKEVRGA